MNDYRYLFGQEVQTECRYCPGAVWWISNWYANHVNYASSRCFLCDPEAPLYRDVDDNLKRRYYAR